MEPLTLLRFDRVGAGYGAGPVLSGVSFEVRAGEAAVLLGPNGAGKTTVTRLALALLHPESGTVTTAGQSTAGRMPEDFASAAGYLFQHPDAQLFERTVQADVAFGPRQLGWPAGRVAEAVAAALDDLGLSDEAGRHPYDLPLARRRLVALAGVLAAAPRLLILDEPTAALDRRSREAVLRVLQRRLADGAGVLAVTHDLAFAAELGARALLLQDHALAWDGPLAGLLDGGPGPSLRAPPALALARRMALDPASLGEAGIAEALVQRCRSLRGSLS